MPALGLTVVHGITTLHHAALRWTVFHYRTPAPHASRYGLCDIWNGNDVICLLNKNKKQRKYRKRLTHCMLRVTLMQAVIAAQIRRRDYKYSIITIITILLLSLLLC